MFIEKGRQLQSVQAVGGIIIDHNTSLKSPNGAFFSMTGDGSNHVHIPLVLMFKDEAFQLLHLLSKQPDLIVYIGDEKFLQESFYEQMEVLESLIAPWNQTCERWIYGRQKRRFCPLVSSKLKSFEIILQQGNEMEQFVQSQSVIQFEHVIETHGNKSAEEITSELFASLNLTAMNFGEQLDNIEAYRLALDKMVRAALTSANQSNSSNAEGQVNEIPVKIIATVSEENQREVPTTTTDTREYTEKRVETEETN